MTPAGLATPHHPHVFEGWEIRPQQRVLCVGGQPVKIGGRAFDVLLTLVQQPERVVTKAELLDAAWPGLVVEENNLSVQVSTLRKLLGPGAIVNVAGLGYRLAAVPLTTAPLAAGPCAVAQPAPPAAAPGIPPATVAARLIGRDADLMALRPHLGQVPVLTLVGTGGVGKTALARELVASLPGAFGDGVHWVDLAPLRPGEGLLPVVARALGVEPDRAGISSGELMRSLAARDAFVVLDNCEHLLDEVAACVGPIAAAGHRLRWLLTSQEPLNLPGERLYRVKPLAVPPPGASPDALAECGAVSLLLARVQAADRSFAADRQGIELAADVCRELDGLPLALEMAAARVASLGLATVRSQLHGRLTLRTGARGAPERHSTLRSTYEWSYALLSPAQQQAFIGLQPFLGGFSAELAALAAGDVDADDPAAEVTGSALEGLRALVDKSLVQRDAPAGGASGTARFALLESAREFAALKLKEAGQLDAVQRRHAEAVAHWFDGAAEKLSAWRDDDWAACYMPERRNAGAALAWACRSGDPALLARLVAACAQLDTFAHLPAAALELAIPLDTLRSAPPPLRARACAELGWAHFLDGNREIGSELLQQALADHEMLGDVPAVHTSLTRLIRLYQGRPGMQAEAAALWQRLCAIDREQVPLRWRLYCDTTVALLFDGQRRLDRLRQLQRVAEGAGFAAQATICRLNVTDELLQQRRFDEAAAEAAQALGTDGAAGTDGEGARWLRAFAMICHNRVHALVRLERYDDAVVPALRMLRAMPSAAHMLMDLFALAAVRQGRTEDAALLAGCSAHIKRERDWSADPAEALLIEDTRLALAAALPAAELARLLDLGAAMSSADVLALAGLA